MRGVWQCLRPHALGSQGLDLLSTCPQSLELIQDGLESPEHGDRSLVILQHPLKIEQQMRHGGSKFLLQPLGDAPSHEASHCTCSGGRLVFQQGQDLTG